MAKQIIGSYSTETGAIAAVNNFKENGMLAEDLTILTNHSVDIDRIENNTDVDVKVGGNTAEDESFWESIKKFFTDETTDANPYEQLTNLGVSSSDAAAYQDDLISGNILVIVDDDTRTGFIPDTPDSGLSASGFNVAPEDELVGNNDLYSETEKVKRREEELQINKNKVQSGEVHIDKTVTEDLQNVQVPVEKNEVHVERRTVTDYEESAKPIGDDESIRVPIVEEEIEVKKKPVVKEEIVIDKSKNLDTEHVADTVKKELVDVTDEYGIDLEDKIGKDKKYRTGTDKLER
ncbi:YsnF/AvaK domain-containing protein [Oceanobacillus chungangensis]|nr:YsnF/AvaK domain-containing protein [Oceanobacillus chungangensis]